MVDVALCLLCVSLRLFFSVVGPASRPPFVHIGFAR
jgi:hypothetical protein